MNSCLLDHAYAYGEMLKAQHPLLGAALLIFLLLLLFKLPGKILGVLFALLRAGLRFIWVACAKVISAIFSLPVRLLKALFSGGPKKDLHDYVHRANTMNPYFYDVKAKPPPKPVPIRKKTSWRDIVMYLAVVLIFLLIVDDYYNNCAMLDGVLPSSL